MSADADYPYDRGDRIVDRNTYFYTPYEGPAFLAAFVASRERLAAGAPSCDAGAADQAVADPVTPAQALFSRISVALTGVVTPEERHWARRALDALIKRFEVTKRVYDAYDEAFKPPASASFREYAAYVAFAEMLDAAYRSNGRLSLLNALLKVMDTLSSVRSALTASLWPRMLRLVDAERRHVEDLAARLGVAPW
jgi:hypothetical protein